MSNIEKHCPLDVGAKPINILLCIKICVGIQKGFCFGVAISTKTHGN